MLEINAGLIAVLVPVLIALAMGLYSRSMILGGMAGLLSISFVAANVAQDTVINIFLIIAFFASMGAAVFMARLILGKEGVE